MSKYKDFKLFERIYERNYSENPNIASDITCLKFKYLKWFADCH